MLSPITAITGGSLANSTRNLIHHIDQPTEWEFISRCIIIRGWCFSTDRGNVKAIRLKSGSLALFGVVNLPRDDVKTAIPEAPGDCTGFEIRGTLPGGRRKIIIEAQLSDGTWHPLSEQTVKVKRQWIPLWLGGGNWTELMFFQMPAHMAYIGRPVRRERFPSLATEAPLPKISIVTPSYQQAAYLDETIRSIVDQAGVNCEYVVQDGGSTDGSVDIIKRLSEKLSVWSSAPDQGQADAIATGFTKTSGSPDDLMAWINSDDYYQPGALAYVAEYFAAHPKVDVLYGNRIVVNEHSHEVARWFLPPHDDGVLKLNDFVPQETLFWRRRIWDQVGGLDRSFKFAMDWDLLLRFAAAGAKIVRVPFFLGCFRIHSAQKTSAQMDSIGRNEIARLRERTHDRPIPSPDLESNPLLLRYLRHSAFNQFLWKLGIRAR